MKKQDVIFTIGLGVASLVATVVLGKKAQEVRQKKLEENPTDDICVEVKEEEAE